MRRAPTADPCSLEHSHRHARSLARESEHRGFTVLEVLVALAIFAFASMVLSSAYINILNGYELATRGLAADADIAFARSIVLTEPDRKKLEEGGDFETSDGRRLQWSVEIEMTSTADLYQVTFTCDISGGTGAAAARPEQVVQRFTVLRPTWTIEPAERDKLREEAKTRILELQARDA